MLGYRVPLSLWVFPSLSRLLCQPPGEGLCQSLHPSFFLLLCQPLARTRCQSQCHSFFQPLCQTLTWARFLCQPRAQTRCQSQCRSFCQVLGKPLSERLCQPLWYLSDHRHRSLPSEPLHLDLLLSGSENKIKRSWQLLFSSIFCRNIEKVNNLKTSLKIVFAYSWKI